jgi:hypothetical protein
METERQFFCAGLLRSSLDMSRFLSHGGLLRVSCCRWACACARETNPQNGLLIWVSRKCYLLFTCMRKYRWKSLVSEVNSLRLLELLRKKYCLARWIRPKLVSFKRSSLKSEPQRFLENLPVPRACCESPLKLQRYLVRLLTIWKQMPTRRWKFIGS